MRWRLCLVSGLCTVGTTPGPSGRWTHKQPSRRNHIGLAPTLFSPAWLAPMCAEKGYSVVHVNVTGRKAGHASMPPTEKGSTAIAMAAGLLGRLDESPPPATLTRPVLELLQRAAFYQPLLPFRMLLAHASSPLLRPVLARMFGVSVEASPGQ